MKRMTAAVMMATMLAAPAWSAGETPEKVVEYRKTSMSATSKHMKALGLIAKGEVNRPGDALDHALGIAAGARDFAALYPAGTGPEAGLKTDAKPEVWSQRADFEAAAKKFADESAKLVEIAKGTDTAALGAQLDAVGKTCGGCHDTFKLKH